MPNFKDEEVDKVIPAAGENADPETKRKVAAVQQNASKYRTVLMKLIHGKQTRDEVIDMLKSSKDPFVTVPEAAMMINDMGVDMMSRAGVKVDTNVQLAASPYLIEDLVKIGEASKSFPPVQEDEIQALTEDTYQMYVERGLKDGSIDPIQLQLETENLMTDEQKAAGLVIGHGKVATRPSQEAQVEQYVNQRVGQRETALKQRMAKEQAIQKRDQVNQALSQRG